ncbi:YIL152W [Saccharomyces arboricola H-6]|uniref:YIL152W n=1 Tax=Saccharomyces arboricola (strain H-6 / AS 2.3317 / CBS 10644) TaxID=1160507 RepID=J8Q3X7_SACAR|nr:YIL152W [Saccharomyces arboricola H-6]
MSRKKRGLVIYQDQKQQQHPSGQSLSSISWSPHHQPFKQQNTNSFTAILSKSSLRQDVRQDGNHLPVSSLVKKPQQQQRRNIPSLNSGPPLQELVQDSHWTSSTSHRSPRKQEKQPQKFYLTSSKLVSELHSSIKDLDTIIQTHKPKFDTIIHDLSHTTILSSNELLINLTMKDTIILHSRTPTINTEWLQNKVNDPEASLVLDSRSFLILCNNIKWYLHWKFI